MTKEARQHMITSIRLFLIIMQVLMYGYVIFCAGVMLSMYLDGPRLYGYDNLNVLLDKNELAFYILLPGMVVIFLLVILLCVIVLLYVAIGIVEFLFKVFTFKWRKKKE